METERGSAVIKLLEFIFASVYHFLGVLLLIIVTGIMISMIAESIRK